MPIRYDPLNTGNNSFCLSYRDFANVGKGFRLPESGANDAVTCCIVCDIDQDGNNEILIGTYGQVITNVYTLMSCRRKESWHIDYLYMKKQEY